MFINAARQLIDAGERTLFVIAGDGPDQPMPERMAADLGIDSHILFTGWRNDIPGIMSAVDILAITSKSEGALTVALEAMALGKPVVSTSVGFLAEYDEYREPGLIADFDSSRQLADKIVSLLRDEELATCCDRAGRALVEREFSSTVMRRRAMDFHSQLLLVGETA
jgi:glycosyltransferase involved in cell wall biosynthesis